MANIKESTIENNAEMVALWQTKLSCQPIDLSNNIIYKNCSEEQRSIFDNMINTLQLQ